MSQFLWKHSRLFTELADSCGEKVDDVVLRVDNQSAIYFANSDVLCARSKHIHTKYLSVRDAILAKEIQTVKVDSSMNLADMCTHPVGRVRLQQFLQMLRTIGDEPEPEIHIEQQFGK